MTQQKIFWQAAMAGLLAFRQLKDRNPAPLRGVLATFVFGLVWWVPARRGLFAVA